MSRRNNVRGPTSALTEFLRESGITPTTIARRARTREVAQPVAGPSAVAQDEGGEEGASGQPNEGEREYASDHLDDSEGESAAPKKRKTTKAQEKLKAKTAAKTKAKGKGKKGDDDDYEDDEDEDAYTALSKMWKDTSKPPIGSFDNCARCQKQFTVTKYTMAANPPPGFLCHTCAKASGNDPFKKPAVPRKRKIPSDKRTITHFEERRLPSLADLCIQVISRHIDDVEALGDIGMLNIDELAKAMARNRSLTPQNATLFYDISNTTLTMYDATNLTSPALCTLAFLNPNLTTLRLEFCGRMDDAVVQAWSSSLPHLKRVELLGPFLVRPPGWKVFFKAHPTLDGFLITQSPRFDLDCVQSLVDNCPNLLELRLKEIGKMEDSFLQPLKKLGGHLTYLDLSYPGTPGALTEEALIDLMSAVCRTLTHLDLSNNTQLTDGFLFQGLKPFARHLSCLLLANILGFTDAGVSEFFSTWKSAALEAGESPNPPLSHIDMSRGHEMGSKALPELLKHSGESLTELNINGWKTSSDKAMNGIALLCPNLRKVDIGWCREVDNWTVREIMEKCEKIEEVKVWGCQRLTEACPRKRNVNLYGVETHSI